METLIAPIQIATSSNGLSDQLKSVSVPHSILSLVPYDCAVEYSILPYSIDDRGRLEVVIADGYSSDSLQKLQMTIGRAVKTKQLDKQAILSLISKNYGPQARGTDARQSVSANARRLIYNSDDSTIVVVNDIIHEAIRLRASDIHLEPFEREMAVRFRIDGVLQEMASISKDRILETISRIKVMSKMDIAEKRPRRHDEDYLFCRRREGH